MRKVIVIGCPGSGKSRFSRALAERTKLPLCHLDMLFWNADKSTEVPDSVTVQLLQGEKILYTDVLSAQNNWQVVYSNMPESDAYYIREVDVPKGFTATYSQKGYTFTVTNTSSLVQTGQLVWPIPLLAAAGLFLLLMGFALLRKTGKRHA